MTVTGDGSAMETSTDTGNTVIQAEEGHVRRGDRVQTKQPTSIRSRMFGVFRKTVEKGTNGKHFNFLKTNSELH